MDIEHKIIKFIKDKTGLKDITRFTNIASPQLKIFDLDAEHIMKLFFKEFNVKSAGFIIEDYF
ncbi:DUF1493 family protein [Flavobacterium sp. '19STA2R22 D10 B1']|uniref:DUF1493 family protein n=1 Tax=Flavobacterium aerium TaxID=3037261 RepID=UPI00278C59FA|nr:DUF1493 family protein [Flavobacterium sp. '19STA2R22 D10 B1']